MPILAIFPVKWRADKGQPAQNGPAEFGGVKGDQALSTTFFTASLALPLACGASPFISWTLPFACMLFEPVILPAACLILPAASLARPELCRLCYPSIDSPMHSFALSKRRDLSLVPSKCIICNLLKNINKTAAAEIARRPRGNRHRALSANQHFDQLLENVTDSCWFRANRGVQPEHRTRPSSFANLLNGGLDRRSKMAVASGPDNLFSIDLFGVFSQKTDNDFDPAIPAS